MPDIYFIEIPTIKQQRTLATDVTVISEDTGDSFTKSTPNIPVENKIERVVFIPEGNATVRETVATRLLEKWGTDQFSIIGKIPLTVSLNFKQKINVIIPTIGFNEDVILQKKEHSIKDFTTTITCGDIILSDNELLARILEETTK